MLYHAALSDSRRKMPRLIFPPLSVNLRRHDPFDVLEAVFFMVYTGCRWSRPPMGYPPYRTVYRHYRRRSAKGCLTRTLRVSVLMKRHRPGQPLFPTETVIDSRSVRTGLPQAISGTDGGKSVKGIRCHIAVDMNGYPLGMDITTANMHGSKRSRCPHRSLFGLRKSLAQRRPGDPHFL